MIERQRQPATDRMAVTADPLQSVREASADYCAKMTTLQEANQGVPNPVGVVTSLLRVPSEKRRRTRPDACESSRESSRMRSWWPPGL